MLTLSICHEFKLLKTNKEQAIKLESMFKNTDEDLRNKFIKKNYLAYIKKSMLLIDARIN